METDWRARAEAAEAKLAAIEAALLSRTTPCAMNPADAAHFQAKGFVRSTTIVRFCYTCSAKRGSAC